MPPKAPPPDFSTFSFPTASAFSAFLHSSHTILPGLYLKLAKKSSGIPSVTAAEAVEVALCYGWIDGRANALDGNYWTVRYTPRRAKSIWSQKNVETVARLIEEGRMQPAGRAAVEAAKKDGRWDRAYAGPASIVEPEDFQEKLGDVETAKEFWKTLNNKERYAVLWRIQIASETARSGRIKAMVDMLAVGKTPGAATTARPIVQKLSKSKSKPKQEVEGTRKVSKVLLEESAMDKKTLVDVQSQPRRAGLRRRGI